MSLIALVGMPGSGKSTVGRQLARHFRLRFADSDHEIERRIGMPVRVYFEMHGEEAFRDLEHEVLADLAPEPDTVLATGGGAVLRADNRDVLRRYRSVLYLRSTAEELHRRLKHDTQRPLLQVEDPLKRLRDLFAARDPLYRETAHYTVEAARPSVSALVNLALMQLELGRDPPDLAQPPASTPRAE